MKAVRASRFFLQIDFGVMDMGLFKILGATETLVYMALRRFVWRDPELGGTRSKRLRTAIAAGKLVAHVSQKKLAEYVGVSRSYVHRALNELRKLGVVTVLEDEDKKKKPRQASLHYVLGEMVPGRRGGQLESYYLDEVTRTAWEELQVYAEKEGERPLEIEMEERREIMGRHLQRLVRGPDDPTDYSDTPVGVGSPPLRTIVTPPPAPSDTVIREQENKELLRENRRTRESEQERASALTRTSGVDHFSPSEEVASAEETEHGESQEEQVDNHKLFCEELPPGLRGAKGRERGLRGAKPLERKMLSGAKGVKREDSTPHTLSGAKLAKLEELRTASEQKKRQAAQERRTGAQASPSHPKSATKQQRENAGRLWAIWAALLDQHYPRALAAPWKGTNARYVRELSDTYGVEAVAAGFQYLVEGWSGISERFTKGRTKTPAVSLLHRFADELMNAGQYYAEYREAVQAWTTWQAAHPGNPYPPEDLQKGYLVAQEGMKTLGMAG